MRRVGGIFLFLVVALLAMVGPSLAAPDEDEAPAGAVPAASERVVRFVGARAADVLAGAGRVEVFRLEAERAKEGEADVGGYKIKGVGAEKGEAFAREWAAVLLDEKSYHFDSDKACGFEPAVGLRVWKGEQQAEVVLCFACDQVAVFSPDPEDGSVRSAMKDFDPARAALVKLTKQAFPDDAAIQKLNEKR